MQDFPADQDVVTQVETLREALPAWIVSTV